MNKIFKIFFFLVVAGIVVYGGITLWYTIFDNPTTAQEYRLPEVDEAGTSFYIPNSGTLVLADKYDQFGDAVGSRLFVLHGFWKMSGREFQYQDTELPLNEKVFGPIEVKKREIKR